MSKYRKASTDFQKWFERQKRVLPWRENPSVYRVWISEIMLQQTQVITVVPYFERFMAHFPTVQKLAQASEEEVLLQWSGLGYYSRARNLHKGAKIISARKKFPTTRDEWLEIPGVGPYTAGAILSIAENQIVPILDGNVERVLSRLRCVGRERGDAFYKKKLWKLASLAVVWGAKYKVKPSVMNQALMELGATVCTPKSPTCGRCPIRSICKSNQAQTTERFPPKKKPKEWIRVDETLSCLLNQDRVLLRFRKSGEWRSGLWDLPEAEPKKLGKPSVFLGEIETRHVVTRHKIYRKTRILKLSTPQSAEPWGVSESLQAGQEFRWVSLDCPEVPLGSAAKKTLEEVRILLHSLPQTQLKHREKMKGEGL